MRDYSIKVDFGRASYFLLNTKFLLLEDFIFLLKIHCCLTSKCTSTAVDKTDSFPVATRPVRLELVSEYSVAEPMKVHKCGKTMTILEFGRLAN